MSFLQTNLVTAGPEESLAEVEGRLKGIEGVPVVDAAGMVRWGWGGVAGAWRRWRGG